MLDEPVGVGEGQAVVVAREHDRLDATGAEGAGVRELGLEVGGAQAATPVLGKDADDDRGGQVRATRRPHRRVAHQLCVGVRKREPVAGDALLHVLDRQRVRRDDRVVDLAPGRQE